MKSSSRSAGISATGHPPPVRLQQDGAAAGGLCLPCPEVPGTVLGADTVLWRGFSTPCWSWWTSGPRSPGVSSMTFHAEVFQGGPLGGTAAPGRAHWGFLQRCSLVTCTDVRPRAVPWCLLQHRGLCGLRWVTDFPESQVPPVLTGLMTASPGDTAHSVRWVRNTWQLARSRCAGKSSSFDRHVSKVGKTTCLSSCYTAGL